ncbi:5-formyltetrahydrofolate cyclo-ligase [Limisalsivibrio acetivorans]|uniref:5-formyltetrahydrofolate cyclo-ligase n=1 Tax=Limisalsivibrio acetivorans TaxID=1304888 RepID=UPI0003B6EE05|nr:5-formyltetrahydrofolate cyclo-ligase [Limisalsivibrio acetivorans]
MTGRNTEMKKALRTEMLGIREGLEKSYIEEVSAAVTERFFNEARGAGNCLLYIDCRNEVQTETLISKLENNGMEVFLPVVQGRELYTGRFSSGLVDGAYGISQPSEIEPRETFDIVVVPGLAFDKDFYRLGYGGGFYDRFLPKIKTGMKAAFAYRFQLVESVYPEKHDIPVDTIFTADSTYRRKQ